MSLDHDFLLLDKTIHPFNSYSEHINSEHAIRLNDFVFGYISDTLQWIPSLNPARKNIPSIGLHRWGPTIITGVGAEVAYEIFRSWGLLFSYGPDHYELTGDWTYTVGNSEDGAYEKLVFKKEGLVSVFESITAMFHAVKSDSDKYYVLHMGI